MNNLLRSVKPHIGKYTLSVAVLWLAYAVLTMIPSNQTALDRYSISAVQLAMIRVSILLPHLLIWVAAALAYAHFKKYYQLIVDSPEASGFRKITQGLLFLLLVAIVPTILKLEIAFNPDDLEVLKTMRITVNYISLGLYFGAFYFFWQASKDFLQTLEPVATRKSGGKIIAAVFILAAAYVWAVFNNATRTVSNDPLVKPTYFLSDPLILLTIVAPYIVMWMLGMFAIANLQTYSKLVKGVIYKRAFKYVSIGMAVIIGLLIPLQFVTQLGSFFGHTSLAVILAVIYVIFIALALGYIYIARGAKELTAIERI